MSLASDLDDLYQQLARGSITAEQYQARKNAALDAVVDNAVASAYRNAPRKLGDPPAVFTGTLTDIRKQVGGSLFIVGGQLVQVQAAESVNARLGDTLTVAGQRTPHGIVGIFRNDTTGYDGAAQLGKIGNRMMMFGGITSAVALLILIGAGYLIFIRGHGWRLRAILAAGSIVGAAALLFLAFLVTVFGSVARQNAKALADSKL